ncbi:MAG: hypothetical protein ACJ760_12275 [Thermoleophilaceae bacterium]
MPAGLERVVAAAVIAVSAAAGEALVLGWLGIGMNALALAGAALLTWAVARAALPAPALPPARELGAWFARLSPGRRAVAGAVAGAALAALASWVVRPRLGFDTFLYHLPIAVSWVQQGDPGAVTKIAAPLTAGAYPALDELMLAWSAGIARSFAVFSVWPFGLLAVIATGGWLGLRSLGVARAAAALAVTAVVVSQQVAGWQSTGASTDPAALAWLVAAAGLCAASLAGPGRAARPVLLAPALLAAALALGTKPTIAPLAAIVVGATAIAHRSALRAIARPLAAAGALGGLVGGWWYARNLVLYGSPLWPFYATPWGTPLPKGPRSHTFLGELHATLSAIGADYLDVFGGSLILLAAALLVPLVDRSRLVLGAWVATAIAVIAWTVTPNTGLTGSYVVIVKLGTLSTVRYLVGGVAAAAVAVALVTRSTGARRWIAYAVLAAAAGVNVWQTFDLESFAAPSPLVVVAGAAVCAALAVAAGRVRPRVRIGRYGRALAVGALVAAIGLGLAAVTPFYLDRLATHGYAAEPDGALLRWFLDQPGFRNGARPVASLALRKSVLAGPRLRHRVDLVGGGSCARLRRRATSGWVVIWGARQPSLRPLFARDPLRCFRDRAPAYRDASIDVYAPPG